MQRSIQNSPAELMDYFKANGWTTARILQPLKDGQTENMVWVFEFESLADYERWYETIHADAGVKERLAKMKELFVRENMSFVAYQSVL